MEGRRKLTAQADHALAVECFGLLYEFIDHREKEEERCLLTRLGAICLAHQDLDSRDSQRVRERVNPACIPVVPKLFQEVDSMDTRRLVEAVDRLTQGGFRFVPTMVGNLLLQCLPRPSFRVGFRGVRRKVDYSQPWMRFEPLFDLVTGMVWGLIQPQHDLPTRARRQHLVQPAERRVGVLPVNHKRSNFFPCPQMHRAIEVRYWGANVQLCNSLHNLH